MKKAMMLMLSLAFALLSCGRLCCRAEVDGQAVEGEFAPGMCRAVYAALLDAAPQVGHGAAVRVNGMYLGCVRDGEALKNALRSRLYADMPTGAVYGRYCEELDISAQYTRVGCYTPQSDMLLLLGGLTSTVYADETGLRLG